MKGNIVYKKVNIYKDGTLHPLFIDKAREFKFGEWMQCEFHPTKGFAPRTIETGDGENHGGWHCCFSPIAPHLSDQLSDGQRRVWIECQTRGASTVYDRPWNQGGAWILCEWIMPLRIVDEDEVSNLITKQHNNIITK